MVAGKRPAGGAGDFEGAHDALRILVVDASVGHGVGFGQLGHEVGQAVGGQLGVQLRAHLGRHGGQLVEAVGNGLHVEARAAGEDDDRVLLE